MQGEGAGRSISSLKANADPGNAKGHPEGWPFCVWLPDLVAVATVPICGHVELRFRVVFCSVPFRHTAIPHAPVPMGSGEET